MMLVQMSLQVWPHGTYLPSLGYLKLHLLVHQNHGIWNHEHSFQHWYWSLYNQSHWWSLHSPPRTLWHWRIGLFTCQNWLQSSHITSGWQLEHLNWDFRTPQMEHVESFPVIQIGDKVLSVVYATACAHICMILFCMHAVPDVHVHFISWLPLTYCSIISYM